MAAGDRFYGEPSWFTDEKTGYRVLKPIARDRNRHMYFTSNPFTDSGDELIFSGIRDGVENYYLLNFVTGWYTQLTDLSGIVVSMAYFHKPTQELFFASGKDIYKVNVKTFVQSKVFSGEHEIGPIAVTCDSRYLISRMADVHSYTNNEMQAIHQPVWRIFKVDLNTGQDYTIMKRSAPLDHIQCHPTRPDWFMYCLWGSGCTHHRIWRANIDGTDGGPIGHEIPNEHRTHEFYALNGDKVCFHGKFCRYDPKYKVFKRTWGIMDWDGANEKVYDCPPGKNAGHSIMSHDGSMVACDGDEYINLLSFDEEAGTCRFNPVAWHNSTGRSNFVHPHPSFSEDERYILYASDMGGKDEGNIYLVDLSSKAKGE